MPARGRSANAERSTLGHRIAVLESSARKVQRSLRTIAVELKQRGLTCADIGKPSRMAPTERKAQLERQAALARAARSQKPSAPKYEKLDTAEKHRREQLRREERAARVIRIVRDWDADMPTAELAEIYGVSKSRVSKIARSHGGKPVHARPAPATIGSQKPERDSEIVSARLSGASLSEIAQAHGLTHQRVYQILRRQK